MLSGVPPFNGKNEKEILKSIRTKEVEFPEKM
jgi:hypothetical protein